MSTGASDEIGVVVCGAAGNMGRTVCGAVAGAEGMRVVAAVDPAFDSEQTGSVAREIEGMSSGGRPFGSLEAALEAGGADVLVDFTYAEAARENLPVAVEAGLAAVVGTTGLDEEFLGVLDTLARKQETGVLLAPNFALGAVLMMQFAAEAARYMDYCEIVELHHEQKRDAPSGTALRTAGIISEVWADRGHEGEVPAHSVRLPGLVADQEVIFGVLGQTLRIEHRTTSREAFMPGVVLAVRRVGDLQGLVVGLENIL